MRAAAYPVDEEFDEQKITRVSKEPGGDGGWSITREDGWGLFIDASSPVEPKVGMLARYYGAGIGSSVRGVFLDGAKVFYRTAAEDKEYQEIALYGKDAAEWLARWDAGDGVWSIEMGGIGPGYEQAIQVAAAEILRHLLAAKYDSERWYDMSTDGQAAWKRDRKMIEKECLYENKRVEALGLSGAQWGAALWLASRLYRVGPRVMVKDQVIRKDGKSRAIQVSRTFPTVPS